MRFRLRFSEEAVRDIDQALIATLDAFGPRKYEEYKSLIRAALEEIAADPFHIARRGKRARHFFLYRISDQEFVDVARLLHDSMDLQRHLPEGFESSGP